MTTQGGVGSYASPWNARDDVGRRVASGVYYCRLEAGAQRRITKLVLTR